MSIQMKMTKIYPLYNASRRAARTARRTRVRESYNTDIWTPFESMSNTVGRPRHDYLEGQTAERPHQTEDDTNSKCDQQLWDQSVRICWFVNLQGSKYANKRMSEQQENKQSRGARGMGPQGGHGKNRLGLHQGRILSERPLAWLQNGGRP